MTLFRNEATWVLRNDLHWKYVRPLKDWCAGIAHTSFSVPEVTAERLGAGLSALDDMLDEVLRDADVIGRLDALRRMEQAHMPGGQQKMWMLSAGKCGTYAMYRFLLESECVYPVQRNDPHYTRPEDRTEMFYRILLGRLEPNYLKRLIVRYLVARTGLLADALCQGKHFCYVLRGDNELAPIVARLFPESRFIHLRRDPFNNFLSFYEKVRRIGEITPLYLDQRFATGRIGGMRAFWGRLREITWNLYCSDVLVSTFFGGLPPERRGEMWVEDIWSGDRKTYDRLCAFLPIEDLPYETFCDHFAISHNKKAYRYQASNGEKERLRRRFDACTTALVEKGAF